jgi:glucosamine--fructose-6-phosphate aminotransferase (isomerizing)
MCGIVGIIAKNSVANELIEGLRRLEYRGYDSAGIATLINGRIERRRAEGKLDNLVARLRNGAGARHDRHRPHALGDARPADREERPPDRDRQGRGRS